MLAPSRGDRLLETQLVDRSFYRRPAVFQHSKKDWKQQDRLELMMRQGSSTRKLMQRKQHLQAIADH